MNARRWRIHGSKWMFPVRDARHATTDGRTSRGENEPTMQARLAQINRRNAEFYAELESKRSQQ
jgi:hypothetical protein